MSLGLFLRLVVEPEQGGLRPGRVERALGFDLAGADRAIGALAAGIPGGSLAVKAGRSGAFESQRRHDHHHHAGAHS